VTDSGGFAARFWQLITENVSIHSLLPPPKKQVEGHRQGTLIWTSEETG
jgi:hypothetical protein